MLVLAYTHTHTHSRVAVVFLAFFPLVIGHTLDLYRNKGGPPRTACVFLWSNGPGKHSEVLCTKRAREDNENFTEVEVGPWGSYVGSIQMMCVEEDRAFYAPFHSFQNGLWGLGCYYWLFPDQYRHVISLSISAQVLLQWTESLASAANEWKTMVSILSFKIS